MAKNKALKDLNPASDSSDDEQYHSTSDVQKSPKKTANSFGSDHEDFSSDDDEEAVFHTTKKTAPRRFEAQQESEDESSDEEAEETPVSAPQDASSKKLDETSAMVQEQAKRSSKLKRLTPEQLAKEQKKIKRTGVCYLSSIPPYMKPVKLRSVLGKFGKLDRIFLKPEDPASYQRRVKYGGNKKKRFTEGWVEFVKKSDAKLCAETMNGNILGGKKSSYYHDDIINIKYLPGFKWFDLTQQISKENEIRQAKLSLEISQQAKLDKSFVNNVERSKYFERKRKAAGGNVEEPKFKRDFSQNSIASTRADAKKEFKKEKNSDNLESVLSKVF
ncbi:hypothetical protein JCM33374_g4928 [Metschnikowia sp. JCM 33374]|nr:hypothetical protein JCM33374_g4928 [Metschnikowia sp. JCM 33374]